MNSIALAIFCSTILLCDLALTVNKIQNDTCDKFYGSMFIIGAAAFVVSLVIPS